MKIIDLLLLKIQDLEISRYMSQLFFSLVVSTVPAIPISIVDRLSGWYIENSIFLTMVFIILALDHAFGSIVHLYIKKDFNRKKNLIGLLVKGFSVCAGYVLFEMVRQIVQDVEFISIYFRVVLQITVIMYPGGSLMKNLSILTNGKFPPAALFKKFEKFNEDLDLNNFKTKNDEEDTDIPSDIGDDKPMQQ